MKCATNKFDSSQSGSLCAQYWTDGAFSAKEFVTKRVFTPLVPHTDVMSHLVRKRSDHMPQSFLTPPWQKKLTQTVIIRTQTDRSTGRVPPENMDLLLPLPRLTSTQLQKQLHFWCFQVFCCRNSFLHIKKCLWRENRQISLSHTCFTHLGSPFNQRSISCKRFGWTNSNQPLGLTSLHVKLWFPEHEGRCPAGFTCLAASPDSDEYLMSRFVQNIWIRLMFSSCLIYPPCWTRADRSALCVLKPVTTWEKEKHCGLQSWLKSC